MLIEAVIGDWNPRENCPGLEKTVCQKYPFHKHISRRDGVALPLDLHKLQFPTWKKWLVHSFACTSPWDKMLNFTPRSSSFLALILIENCTFFRLGKSTLLASQFPHDTKVHETQEWDIKVILGNNSKISVSRNWINTTINPKKWFFCAERMVFFSSEKNWYKMCWIIRSDIAQLSFSCFQAPKEWVRL
jgi:hypothetical protein